MFGMRKEWKSRRPAAYAGLSLLMTLALLLARPRVAEAGINMTGDWYLAIAQQPSFLVHFVQTGTSLQIQGSFQYQQGTIDSASGAFTWAGIDFTGGGCGTGLQGTTDGRLLIGTAFEIVTPPDCHSIFCACTGSIPLGPLYGSKSPCGNGVVDPDEQCDDGPANGTPGACCAVGCTLQPARTPCADDGDLCTVDECVGIIDVCAHVVAPSGGCAAPIVPKGASIVLRTGRSGHNRARFTWGNGPAVPLADFGDPGSELTRLCIYRQPGHEWVSVAGASPSVSEGGVWTQTSMGWKFRSRTGAPDGVTGVTLEAATVPRKAKLKVTAQADPAFTLPLPQEPAMLVQFKTSLGTCWEATFLTATKSTDTVFRAKSDTP